MREKRPIRDLKHHRRTSPMRAYGTLFLVLLLLCLFNVSNCTKKSFKKEIIIARIDDDQITESDFTDYYADKEILNLSPNVKRKLLLNMLMERVLNDYLSNIRPATQEDVLAFLGEEDDKNIDQIVIEKISKMLSLKKKLQEEIEINISEKETEDYYREHEDEFFTKEAILLSQILLKEEADAKKVYREIGGKVDKFEEFAAIYNTEAYRVKNGAIGWVERGDLPSELEEMVFAQRPGRIYPPRKTSFGYHIFYVKKKVSSKFIPYEEALPAIKSALIRDKVDVAYDSLIKKLLAEHDVHINEEYLYR